MYHIRPFTYHLVSRLEEYNAKGHTSEGTDHAHTDTPPSCSQDSNTGNGGGSYKLVKSISVSTVSDTKTDFDIVVCSC